MKKQEPTRVSDVMTSDVFVCRAHDSIEEAARILWEHDCGCLPVVDEDGIVIAMLTDRDICMASYTQGRALHQIKVEVAMSKNVVCCGPQDDVADAARSMSNHGVRRLPVTDGKGRIQGILSVNDLACACRAPHINRAQRDRVETAMLQALVEVSRRRREEGETSAMEFRAMPPGEEGAIPIAESVPYNTTGTRES